MIAVEHKNIPASAKPEWYRNRSDFVTYVSVSYVFAILIFVAVLALFDAIETVLWSSADGLLSSLLSALIVLVASTPLMAILGILLTFPIPFVAVLFGYPLWLLIVPRLVGSGLPKWLILTIASSAVALIPVASCCLIALALFDGVIGWSTTAFLGAVSLCGVIASNVVVRVYFLNSNSTDN